MAEIKKSNSIKDILDPILQQAYDSWGGKTGEERKEHVLKLITRTVNQYSVILGLTKLEVLKAIETRRDYSVCNYYQSANFPDLLEVAIYNSRDDFKTKHPTGLFICPNCGGESSDPQVCNSGKKVKKGICDWKSYGLFGCLGKGHTLLFKDTFLNDGLVITIFNPKI